MALLFFLKRRQTSLSWLFFLLFFRGWVFAAAALLIKTSSFSAGIFGPDARADKGVQKVDHQHNDAEQSGKEKCTRHDNRNILLSNGRDDMYAQAGDGKDRFSNNGAAQKSAELHAQHSDDGQKGVFQRMTPDDDFLRGTLGARRMDVVSADGRAWSNGSGAAGWPHRRASW